MLHCKNWKKKLKYDSMFAPFCVYWKLLSMLNSCFGTTLKEILLTSYEHFMRYLLSYIAWICSMLILWFVS